MRIHIKIATVAFCIGLMAAYAIFSRERPAEKGCEHYADPIRVNVSQTEFRIPAVYQPVLQDKIGFAGALIKKSPRPKEFYNNIQKGYCQAEDENAFEVPGFSVSIPYRDITSASGAGKAPLGNSNITILPARKEPLTIYCELLRRFQKGESNDKLGSEGNSFVSLKDKTLGWQIFYSTQHTFFTNPVIIYCSEKPNISPGKSSGRACKMVSPINNDVMMRYAGFNDEVVPPEQWGAFIEGYETLLRGMLTEAEASRTFDGCRYF